MVKTKHGTFTAAHVLVVEVVVGEVGPVTIIARTLGVEVGLGDHVVVGLERPVGLQRPDVQLPESSDQALNCFGPWFAMPGTECARVVLEVTCP